MIAVLDHLVVAAATLEQGEDHLEAMLGVRPQRGGKHVAMGTHNSLLRLDARTSSSLSPSIPKASHRLGRAGSRSTRPRCGKRCLRARS
jgi:hypothetical protein